MPAGARHLGMAVVSTAPQNRLDPIAQEQHGADKHGSTQVSSRTWRQKANMRFVRQKFVPDTGNPNFSKNYRLLMFPALKIFQIDPKYSCSPRVRARLEKIKVEEAKVFSSTAR